MQNINHDDFYRVVMGPRLIVRKGINFEKSGAISQNIKEQEHFHNSKYRNTNFIHQLENKRKPPWKSQTKESNTYGINRLAKHFIPTSFLL